MPSEKIDPRLKSRPESMSGPEAVDTHYPLFIEEEYPMLVQLDGHSLVQTNVQETSPPEIPLPIVLDGKIIMSSVISTKRYIARTDYDIGMPAWDYSVLEEFVETGQIYPILRIRNECDPCDKSAYAYTPTTPFSDVKTSDNLTAGGIDTAENIIGKTTSFSVAVVERIMGLRFSLARDDILQPLHAVVWIEGDHCHDLDFCPDDIAVGGESSLLDYYATTTTKWDTDTAIAGLTPGMIVTDLKLYKGILVGTYADDLDPAVALTGGIFYVQDGVLTISTSGGLAIGAAMYGVDYIDNQWVAVGQNAEIHSTTTDALADWTAIVTAVTATHLMCIAGDIWNDVFYVGDSVGGAFTISRSVVADITALVDAGGLLASVLSVAVVDDDFVLYGGDSGYVMENTAASAGGVYTVYNLGANDVNAIAGSRWRQLFGHGDEIIERSLLTVEHGRLTFDTVDFLGGQVPSGDIMDMDFVRRYNGANFFVAVTDGNELIFISICLSKC